MMTSKEATMSPMKSLTKDQVVDRMMHYSQRDLYEQCQESHKDFYGVRGRHMFDWPIPELVSWWISLYEWNGIGQYWEPIGGFSDD
jgi:hypothetical protein